jgi:anti-anti-sigma factor
MNSITTEHLEDRVILRVHGDFTFDVNRAFRDAYQACPPTSHFEVDLRTAEYMDSAGLGMLLQLREYAGGDSSRVTISGASPNIRSILDIANFSRLFNLG